MTPFEALYGRNTSLSSRLYPGTTKVAALGRDAAFSLTYPDPTQSQHQSGTSSA
ncbi:unnamed protein product [Rhodiola kirilowii]